MVTVEAKHVDVVEDRHAVGYETALHNAEVKHVDVVENYELIAKNTRPHRWQPGQSGNPGGSYQGRHLTKAYHKLLPEVCPTDKQGRTYAELVALGMIQASMAGDARAAKEVREVTEGKLPTKIELTGGLTIEHILTTATEEELDGIIEGYISRSGPGAEEARCLSSGGEGSAEENSASAGA